MAVEGSVNLLVVVAILFKEVPQEHQLDLLAASQRHLALCTRVDSEPHGVTSQKTAFLTVTP
jgi:hypothetical protein